MSQEQIQTNGFTRRRALGMGVAGAAALALAACSNGTGASSPSAFPSATGPQKKGGTLRVGLVSAGSSGSMDPQRGFGVTANEARWMALYDRLAGYNADGRYELGLAEEISTNATATEWTIRIPDGVEFHNGKTAGADDLAFTIRRLADKNSQYSLFWQEADVAGLKKLDNRTIRIPLKNPNAVFDEQAIVFVGSSLLPVGFDPNKPVGTGPFKLVSFTPGQSTVYKAFENYSGKQPAFVDELQLIEFDDPTARVNALLAGQLDAVTSIPSSQVKILQNNRDYQPLIHESGTWTPITMNWNQAPFDDNRVRTAFKLIANRPQLVNAALGGQGSVANDVFGRYDPFFQGEILPQREQDIEQAKSLLKAAGHENLQVTMNASPVGAGLVEAATVFAQQAKAAGVDIQLKQIPPSNYYGAQFPYALGVDYWEGTGYWQSSYYSMSPFAPVSETGFNNPDWISLWTQARRELDATKRNEIVGQMQKIEYDTGGYLVWGFADFVDAVSKKTTGWRPGKFALALSNLEFNYISLT